MSLFCRSKFSLSSLDIDKFEFKNHRLPKIDVKINGDVKEVLQKLVKVKTLNNETIDTVLLARKKLNSRAVSLDHLCKRFFIDLSNRRFHGALLDCKLLSEVYLELLGGRQTSLGLTKITKSNHNLKQKNLEFKNKIHKTIISEKEINDHKNFVADLKNALWHKVNY